MNADLSQWNLETLVTQITKRFVNLEPDAVDDGIHEALRTIGEFAGVDRGYLFTFSADGTAMTNTHEWCIEGIEPQRDRLVDLPVTAFPWFCPRIKELETVHVPRVSELGPEAEAERTEWQAESIRSLLCIPTVCGGVLVGFVGFDSVRTEKTWSPPQLALLRIVGEIMGGVLERRRVEERLRLLSSVVEQTTEGIGAIDLEGNLLFVSQAFAEMHGYRPDELAGEHVSILHHADRLEELQRATRQIEETGRFRGEVWHVHRDGSLFPVLMSGSLIRDAAGNPVGISGTFVDVTEQRIQQEVSRESERLLRAQHQALVELAKGRALHEGDLETGLRRITEAATRALEVDRASVWFYNEDRSRIRCADLFQRGKNCHSRGTEVTAADHPMYFKALDEQRLIAADDAPNDQATCEFSEDYLAPLGITSMLDAPIRVEGRMVGVVCHEHVGTPRGWTGAEQHFAGSIADLVALAIEESERKRAEQALRESEELYRSLVETSPDAIVLIGPDGRFIMANRRAAKLHGFESVEEMIGQHAFDLVAPEDRPRAAEALERVFDSDSIRNIQTRMLRKDGTFFDGESSLSPVGDGEKKPSRMVGVLRDVTERNRLQEQLLQTQKLESIGTLAGGIAHDFNNLLVVIVGNCSILQRDETLSARVQQFLTDIMTAAERGSALTHQLLAYARGGLQQPVSTDLNRAVTAVLDMLRRTSPPQIELNRA